MVLKKMAAAAALLAFAAPGAAFDVRDAGASTMFYISIPRQWIIAGPVALGAAAAIGGKDRSTNSSPQQQHTAPAPHR
jgi:hypothetical protein